MAAAGASRSSATRCRFSSGAGDGRTIGAPLALLIANRDYENWRERERAALDHARAPATPTWPARIKYGLDDLRLVAERASARETAARVAVGAVASALAGAGGRHTWAAMCEAIGGVAGRR